ncbi:MAG: C39 family peptidase [Acidobacteria bacterium]|nr:C39 family peptidase [Acidobacteriota bacterium]MDA1236349.1 C39 family peptidase [Acidobacteriota bacterium]
MRKRLLALSLLLAAAVSAAGVTGLWIDVPFVKQTDRACGAANAAMLLRYWADKGFPLRGADAKLADLHRQLYSKQDKGTTGQALEALLEDAGLRTFIFRGEYADLEKHLAAGRPLIVCVDPPRGGTLHYALVVGLDPETDTVLLNDPARKKLARYDRRDFLASWAATDNWTLLAVPGSAN